MSPPSNKSESGLARLLGSGTSGLLELFIFHPVDTVAKRLMTNPTKVKSFFIYYIFFFPKNQNQIYLLLLYRFLYRGHLYLKVSVTLIWLSSR